MTRRAPPNHAQREPLFAPDGSGLTPTYYTGVALGPSGVGKTTFAENLAFFYHRGTSVTGRVWAISPYDAWDHVDGVKSLWPKDDVDGVEDLLRASTEWPPGLIIGDDADAYIGPHPTRWVKRYIVANRHIQKDQLWIARRPQGLPKDLFGVMHFVALFAGCLMEPGARHYLEETFPEEILDAVPMVPFSYLLITRDGARWKYEKRKTKARSIVTKSDKT